MRKKMTLDVLSQQLAIRLNKLLPGDKAHEVMRAHPVGDVIPNFQHQLPPRPGGVLILLYEQQGRIFFPLIKRPEYLGPHSGQISLPGGKSEAGEDALHTALREGEEEIGVHQQDMEVLGRLTNFLVIPSNFIVTPVIAKIAYAPVFKPDPREVAGIFSCDMETLISENAVQTKEILAAGRFRMMAPHFAIENEVVWGATAMMLNEFRIVLREIFTE